MDAPSRPIAASGTHFGINWTNGNVFINPLVMGSVRPTGGQMRASWNYSVTTPGYMPANRSSGAPAGYVKDPRLPYHVTISSFTLLDLSDTQPEWFVNTRKVGSVTITASEPLDLDPRISNWRSLP